MSFRIKQINEQLRNDLAMLISEVAPFKDGLITITNVKTSPDLKNAKIYISVIPENHTGSALKVLRKNIKLLTSELRQKVHMKYIPRLSFHMDEKIKYMNEIDDVLRKIEKEDGRDNEENPSQDKKNG
ncbi:30S ribosome-binding factor RbfA [Candidatus Parcubacteria bacterium]|nr:MAG: 30S ribosome-binding factor RbfA [Candidatus Parcubacteria bacterium]